MSLMPIVCNGTELLGYEPRRSAAIFGLDVSDAGRGNGSQDEFENAGVPPFLHVFNQPVSTKHREKEPGYNLLTLCESM